jgi:thiamine-phosphate pyrophosphorylase
MGGCLLYYITDRVAFPGDESSRRHCLLEKISEATRAGVDYIQLREQDLPARELEFLARQAISAIREAQQLTPDRQLLTPVLLINSRVDVAIASEADGVHLRSEDISPEDVRKTWMYGAGTPFDRLRAGSARELSPRTPLIGASCHSPEEVAQAANRASFAVFGPVFEKKAIPGTRATGLAILEKACRADIPVLALGGVTLSNARSCLEAGAAGIAAIRLFQENDIAQVVRTLRQLVA